MAAPLAKRAKPSYAGGRLHTEDFLEDFSPVVVSLENDGLPSLFVFLDDTKATQSQYVIAALAKKFLSNAFASKRKKTEESDLHRQFENQSEESTD